MFKYEHVSPLYIYNVYIYYTIYQCQLKISGIACIYIYVCVCPGYAVFKNLILDPQDVWLPPEVISRFSPPMPIPVMMRATIKAFSHHANIPGISWDLWKWPFDKYTLYMELRGRSTEICPCMDIYGMYTLCNHIFIGHNCGFENGVPPMSLSLTIQWETTSLPDETTW